MNQHEGGRWIGDPTAFHAEGAFWDTSRLLYVDMLSGDIITHDKHGNRRMSVSDVEGLLLTLPEIRRELQAAGRPVEKSTAA